MMSRLAVLVALLVVICSTVLAAGSEIAFVRDGDIYVATPEGKVLRRLTTDGQNAFPMWSPDGKYIAFAKASKVMIKGGHEFTVASLWIVTPGGKYTRSITRPKAFTAYYPAAWLPDGRGLVVTANALESDVPAELQIVTLNGRPYGKASIWARVMPTGAHYGVGQHQLTYGDALAFSPVSKRMVFSRAVFFPRGSREAELGPDGYWTDLCLMNTNGTAFRRIARLPLTTNVVCLRWSPGGTRLLSQESSWSSGKHSVTVRVRDLNGRTVRRLVDLRIQSYSGMDWSPDGKRVIYQDPDEFYNGHKDQSFEHPEGFELMSSHSSVWLINADGTGKRKILDNACHPNWR